jgi:choline-glycine betaine transporter
MVLKRKVTSPIYWEGMLTGAMGCFLFFMVMGNYGLYLQLSGELDVVTILNQQSPTAAIFAMLQERRGQLGS